LIITTVKCAVGLFFVAITVVVLTHTTTSAESTLMTWVIDGAKREAIVYPPTAKDLSGKVPLVFAFHGYGDDIQGFQQVDLQNAWPQAMVVYFQGLPTSRSNAPGLPGWQVQTGTAGDRDLKLVDRALASLRQQYRIDETRVYATGFSNGAAFTYLLWAERPSVFAAYAPVAAVMRASTPPRMPRPILHVAGRQDSRIKFESQEETIELARKINGATGKGEGCGVGCTLYSSSRGAPVMTWIHAGGHEYPEGTSERIVRFFKQHSMNESTK
jgi:polyhydroxybutyrate depolymerase